MPGAADLGPGKQVAGLVHHRDVARRQLRHAAGDQVLDRADLSGVQHAARDTGSTSTEALGCCCSRTNTRRARNRQVHARRLHRGHRLDRARQLAGERALVVDLLGELADAELLRVHQLEADRAALGQALRGQLQAQLVDLVAGHQDHAAALGDVIGNVLLRERGDDLAAVAVGQVGVENPVLGGAGPQERDHDQRDGGGQGRQQTDFLGVAEGAEAPCEGAYALTGRRSGLTGSLSHQCCRWNAAGIVLGGSQSDACRLEAPFTPAYS